MDYGRREDGGAEYGIFSNDGSCVWRISDSVCKTHGKSKHLSVYETFSTVY